MNAQGARTGMLKEQRADIQDKSLTQKRNVRVACLHVPQLFLQIMEREHGKKEAALALRDGMTITQLNPQAYDAGVRVGMRVEAAQAQCPDMLVVEVDAERFLQERLSITEALRSCSPWVGWHARWPDCFWLRGDGLVVLWQSASQWANGVHEQVQLMGWRSTVVVGFSPFYTMALAHQMTNAPLVLRHEEQERALAYRVPLARVMHDARLVAEYARLGVETMQDLAAFPAGSLHRRYGPDAALWARWARQEEALVVAWQHARVQDEVRVAWDEAIFRHTVLLFVLQDPIARLLGQLERAAYACGLLEVSFEFDWPQRVDDKISERARQLGIEWGESLEVQVSPAAPHLDSERWATLLRLRLDRMTFPTGVIAVTLRARRARAEATQEKWSGTEQVLMPNALLEVIVKLRIRLEASHVGHLEVGMAHLPEARQQLRTIQHLARPAPQQVEQPRCIRRLYAQPIYMCAASKNVMLTQWPASPKPVNIASWHGPHIIDGGWWHRRVQRDYYYVLLEDGDIVWAYYDRVRKSWWKQGLVF